MIPRDKLLHIGLGMLAICCVLPALLYYEMLGLGACLAYATTMTGVLYEANQWLRKEGQVEWLDTFATAAPGWVAWFILILI